MKKKYFSLFSVICVFLLILSCNSEEVLELDQQANTDLIDKIDEAEVVEIQSDFENNNVSPIPPSGDFTQKNSSEVCGNIIEVPLLAGSRERNIGNVTISNDEDNYYISYTITKDNWSIKSLHLYIGEKRSIPTYWFGYPKLWRFPYHAFPGYYKPNVKNFTFRIPISSIDLNCSTIVANAIVKNNRTRRYKSAFAFDRASFSSDHTVDSHYNTGYYRCNYGNWYKYIDYCKQDCSPGGGECLVVENSAWVNNDINVYTIGGLVDGTGSQLSNWENDVIDSGGAITSITEWEGSTPFSGTGFSMTHSYSRGAAPIVNASLVNEFQSGSGNTGVNIELPDPDTAPSPYILTTDITFSSPVNASGFDLVDLYDYGGNVMTGIEITVDDNLVWQTPRSNGVGLNGQSLLDYADGNGTVQGQMVFGENIENFIGVISEAPFQKSLLNILLMKLYHHQQVEIIMGLITYALQH